MATTQELLDDAQAKYHKLVTGQLARVYVDANGERVEYTATNRAALLAYIADLQRQLDSTTVLGPMRPFL